MSAPRVYCSGPLFSPEEVAGMAHLAATLEAAGLDTFLPQRDGVEAYVMRHVGRPWAGSPALRGLGAAIGRATFALDVYQILERCDALVLNMNGRVPDEGAVAETAMAWMAGRPLVIYKRDDRSVFRGEDNAMVTGLGRFTTVARVADLPGALSARLAGATAPRPALAPAVAATVRRGERVWALVSALPAPGTGHLDEPELLARLAALGTDDAVPTADDGSS